MVTAAFSNQKKDLPVVFHPSVGYNHEICGIGLSMPIVSQFHCNLCHVKSHKDSAENIDRSSVIQKLAESIQERWANVVDHWLLQLHVFLFTVPTSLFELHWIFHGVLSRARIAFTLPLYSSSRDICLHRSVTPVRGICVQAQRCFRIYLCQWSIL